MKFSGLMFDILTVLLAYDQDVAGLLQLCIPHILSPVSSGLSYYSCVSD